MDIPGPFFGGLDSEDGELSTNMGTEGLGGVILFRTAEKNTGQNRKTKGQEYHAYNDIIISHYYDYNDYYYY